MYSRNTFVIIFVTQFSLQLLLYSTSWTQVIGLFKCYLNACVNYYCYELIKNENKYMEKHT